MVDLFKALGVNPPMLVGCSDREIIEILKANYFKLSHIYHPDHGDNKKRFSEVTSAYEFLMKGNAYSPSELLEAISNEKPKGLKNKSGLEGLEIELRNVENEKDILEKALVRAWELQSNAVTGAKATEYEVLLSTNRNRKNYFSDALYASLKIDFYKGSLSDLKIMRLVWIDPTRSLVPSTIPKEMVFFQKGMFGYLEVDPEKVGILMPCDIKAVGFAELAHPNWKVGCETCNYLQEFIEGKIYNGSPPDLLQGRILDFSFEPVEGYALLGSLETNRLIMLGYVTHIPE